MILEHILNSKNWYKIVVNYQNFDDLSKLVPNNPGLYMINTDAPVEAFLALTKLKLINSYNIRERAKQAIMLPKELLISKLKKKYLCIYIGHQKNLRQRFKEHFRGYNQTACLALFEHKSLRKYNWEFQFIDLTQFKNYKDSKLLRNILENHLRSNKGWPLLCAQ